MRTETLYTGGTVNYPDRWCFAFNKHYVEVNNSNVSGLVTVTVTDTTRPFEAKKLYCYAINGNFKIEIGQAMRAVLDNPLNTRCKYVHVSVGSHMEEIISFHTYIVWGEVNTNDDFLQYSDFEIEDDILYLDRHIRWFINYPLTISLIKRTVPMDIVDKSTSELGISSTEETTLTYDRTISDLAVFDDSFDETFVERFDDKLTERIKITPCAQKEGVYLRWIDHFGYTQYYLFDKGEVTLKSTSNETEVEDTNYQGYSLKRPLHIEVEKTLKCGAIDLPDDILKHVESISNALCVDMYGVNGWTPVKVETNNMEENKKIKRDFEISVTFQVVTQNLL